MTTSSRTDRAIHFTKASQMKSDDTTRSHISALVSIEAERTSLFKAQGANCFSCSHYSKEKYTHCCTRPEKVKRYINPLSICATYLKEFLKP